MLIELSLNIFKLRKPELRALQATIVATHNFSRSLKTSMSLLGALLVEYKFAYSYLPFANAALPVQVAHEK
jgi:hypothetical protein